VGGTEGAELAAGALSSRVFQESQIEGCNHQNNADIHDQPFQELMPKEQQIYDNDTGSHYQNAKHHIGIPWHFNHPS
jgi:hypothetical protein